jgi:hypothetical protein
VCLARPKYAVLVCEVAAGAIGRGLDLSGFGNGIGLA